jgi:hypothetical protein
VSENVEPDSPAATASKILILADFLSSVPPGQLRIVNLLADRTSEGTWSIGAPPIKLFCENQACDRETFFDLQGHGGTFNYNQRAWTYLLYRCRHCKQSSKLFALLVNLELKNRETLRGDAEKIGEWPAFGPHVPTRVNKLIGPDRDFFFKGRRAESQGMGIGAFGYYRRVVENQKGRIIDEMIKVCERIGASPKVIKELQVAKAETQFNKAIQKIKKGIPDVLKIDGHNPLLLLHNALSEGLHAQDDEQCLELARSIRVVLSELAERLDQALKEEAELTTAVSRLLTARSNKGSKATNTPTESDATGSMQPASPES